MKKLDIVTELRTAILHGRAEANMITLNPESGEENYTFRTLDFDPNTHGSTILQAYLYGAFNSWRSHEGELQAIIYKAALFGKERLCYVLGTEQSCRDYLLNHEVHQLGRKVEVSNVIKSVDDVLDMRQN